MVEDIIETWWYRLLKVLGVIVILLSVIAYLLVVIPKLKNIEYVYNFEDGYTSVKSRQYNCKLKYHCGYFYSKEGLSTAIPKSFKEEIKKLDVKIHEKKCKVKSDEYDIFCELDIVPESPLENHVKFKVKSYYSVGEMMWACLGLIVFTLILCFLFLILFRVVLYIVYGHSLIRKS